MGSCFMFNYAKAEKIFAARGRGPLKGDASFLFWENRSLSRSGSLTQGKPNPVLLMDGDRSYLSVHP